MIVTVPDHRWWSLREWLLCQEGRPWAIRLYRTRLVRWYWRRGRHR